MDQLQVTSWYKSYICHVRLTADQQRRDAKLQSPSTPRLRCKSADYNEKCVQNLYQTRLDGPITGHILVQIVHLPCSLDSGSEKTRCDASIAKHNSSPLQIWRLQRNICSKFVPESSRWTNYRSRPGIFFTFAIFSRQRISKDSMRCFDCQACLFSAANLRSDEKENL